MRSRDAGTAALTSAHGWDHVVVGAGSAGCAVAGRLAAAGRRVLLLEAGGGDASPLLRLPAAVMHVMRNPRYDWMYRGDADPSIGGRELVWPAGKVLGGSSSINGMVYVRGLAADYGRWVDAGASGWDYASLLPSFRRLESWLGPAAPERGTDGPVSTSPAQYVHPLAHELLAGARSLGYAVHDDLNAAAADGFGLTQVTIARGLRSSAARAYLHRLERRALLHVRTHALASRLLFAGQRCTGVEFRHEGRLQSAHCTVEVIVCAGAIASPALLLRSGIGDASELASFGIPLVRHSPAVGANLQEHAGIAVAYAARVPTLNQEGRGWRALRAGIRWLLTRRGPAAAAVVHVTGFVRTRAELPSTDVQLQFVPLGYDDSGARPRMARDDRVGFTINPCRPQSRGRVRLAARDPQAAPRIEHQLLGADSDVTTLAAGAAIVRRLAATPPLAQRLRGEIFPGPQVQSAAEWAAMARATCFGQGHPVGTCRMGASDAVLDPQLRVRGVAGLRVADASVMPTITSGNTNAVAMMIGERAAELILGSTP